MAVSPDMSKHVRKFLMRPQTRGVFLYPGKLPGVFAIDERFFWWLQFPSKVFPSLQKNTGSRYWRSCGLWLISVTQLLAWLFPWSCIIWQKYLQNKYFLSFLLLCCLHTHAIQSCCFVSWQNNHTPPIISWIFCAFSVEIGTTWLLKWKNPISRTVRLLILLPRSVCSVTICQPWRHGRHWKYQ